ncbi:Uncharacterised protein [Yersinia bercovieri]|uniref:ABC-three component system protein n=1 Tax=Yersinia bercovieri TaxID=634 RepID=UPI00061C6407|nr:ABC-three component system protein [Yersinia bercovieri]CNF73389.1 Uncharacterised protein [Yersinia bercovieri]
MGKPLGTILTWNDEIWEEFVHDWLCQCYSDIYVGHQRLGGTGDKGRDVVGYLTDPNQDLYEWNNFQCKFYKKRINFSHVADEFGKLLFFTKNKSYPAPSKYFFVGPYDLSTSFSDLLKKPEELKSKIIEVWDVAIKNKVSKSFSVPLDEEMLAHVNSFDFSIFYSMPLAQILKDISLTYLYFKYFNELYGTRVIPKDIPEFNSKVESVYVNELLGVYSQVKSISIEKIDELPYPYNMHFNSCRNDFFFASSLERYMRDSFIEDNFRFLKTCISSSVQSILFKSHGSAYDKCNEVLAHASLTHISNELLTKLCEAPDKKGICHHLINDGEMKWIF